MTDFWGYEPKSREQLFDEQMQIFAHNIIAVEKEFKIEIYYDYNYLKFIEKLNYLIEMQNELEKKK